MVFHDVDLTYTVIVPSGLWIEKQNRLESYHIFHRIVIKALASLNIPSSLVESGTEPVDRSTMCCFTSPTRYDVVANDNSVEGPSKVAGAAQRRTKYGILHQGSIVIDDISSKRELLTEYLLSAFIKELNISFNDFEPSTEFFSSAKKLAEEKYAKKNWNKYRKI